MFKKNMFAIIVIIALAGYTFYDLQLKEDKKEAEVLKTEQKNKTSELMDDEEVQSPAPSGKTGVKEGDLAPDFTLNTLDGKEVKLSDFQGKKVVLNLWASWCPPCKAEMPHMQTYYEKNKDKENVEILAVNLTTMEKDQSKIKTFVDDYGLTFPIPLDESGDIGITFEGFSIPTTYMIDTKGVIQKRIVGPMNEEFLSDMVTRLK
ncbi:TlpA disulfide reductase family protein [Fictibacillus phosphorivorans]|uniref:TlpA disulfide reductase family protein n=1 Tax=Fictibacillus phosphorivorans TaxID=1221500 RepID=UPI003CFAC5DF